MSIDDKIEELTNGEMGVSISAKYGMLYPFSSLRRVAEKMAEWKDEQFEEEKKELLGLVEMLPVDEKNQSIIDDLKGCQQFNEILINSMNNY